LGLGGLRAFGGLFLAGGFNEKNAPWIIVRGSKGTTAEDTFP
jgi:hypothetical protein